MTFFVKPTASWLRSLLTIVLCTDGTADRPVQRRL